MAAIAEIFVREEKPRSRNQQIIEYLPYVKRIVHRIAIHLPPSAEIEDLVSAGVIGLIEAIEDYDSAKDNKFMTYAVFRIKGAVLSELRARDYLSRSSRKKIRELDRAYAMIEQKLGRAASDEEVAEELGVDLEKFYEFKRISGISLISLEEVGCTSKEEEESLLSSLLHGNTQGGLPFVRLKEIEAALGRAIEQLPEKEKLVISLYYWDELTMKEIGKVLDLTESRVSQLHAQAVTHLRKKLKKEGLITAP